MTTPSNEQFEGLVEKPELTGFYVTAETFAGGSVEQCIHDLASFAQRLGCWVKCDVNGIEVLTPPNATGSVMWSNYQKARDRNAKFVSLNVIPHGDKPATLKDAS